MKTLFKLLGSAIAVSATLLATPRSGQAQPYPSRPVQLVVGYAQGGTGDIIARAIADKLAKALGQPVTVENRPGASGTVAAQSVARATPDGYTLLIGQPAEIVINPNLIRDVGYNPERDLQPVALVAVVPSVLVVPSAAPYNSVQDLLRAARESPRGLVFASGGPGTPPHLAGEILTCRKRRPNEPRRLRGSRTSPGSSRRGSCGFRVSSVLHGRAVRDSRKTENAGCVIRATCHRSTERSHG